jgi:hypothetical protein
MLLCINFYCYIFFKDTAHYGDAARFHVVIVTQNDRFDDKIKQSSKLVTLIKKTT